MIVPLAILLLATAASSKSMGAVGRGKVGPFGYVLRPHDGGIEWSIAWEGVPSGVSADVGEALRDVFEAVVPYAADNDAVSYFALAKDGSIRGYAAALERGGKWPWQTRDPSTTRDFAGSARSRAEAMTLALQFMGVWS